MKTKTITVCDALFIDVSCDHNDSTDIKCGGPAILGYEFYVSPDENRQEIYDFIYKCIKKYRRPFIAISFRPENNFPVDNLWTREQIEECIAENGF
jgi:hypothetical protein